jgi:hypothetical protein
LPFCAISLKKRKRKSEENEWNWEGRKIELGSQFRCLGYTFNERAISGTYHRDNEEAK